MKTTTLDRVFLRPLVSSLFSEGGPSRRSTQGAGTTSSLADPLPPKKHEISLVIPSGSFNALLVF
jgi:hypothetical protein